MRFSEMIEGLQILAKYDEKGLEAHVAGADHDVFWGAAAEIDFDSAPIYYNEYGEKEPVDSRVSTDDQRRLRELGWFIQEDTESWTHFC